MIVHRLLPTVHLPPTRHARQHRQPVTLPRGIVRHQERLLRARPHQAHLPHYHIQQLRQFIQTRPSQYAAHPRNPVIIKRLRLWPKTRRVHRHSPKLIQHEPPPTLADPLLPKDTRSSRVQTNHQPNHHQHRNQQNQTNHTQTQIQNPLRNPVSRRSSPLSTKPIVHPRSRRRNHHRPPDPHLAPVFFFCVWWYTSPWPGVHMQGASSVARRSRIARAGTRRFVAAPGRRREIKRTACARPATTIRTTPLTSLVPPPHTP